MGKKNPAEQLKTEKDSKAKPAKAENKAKTDKSTKSDKPKTSNKGKNGKKEPEKKTVGKWFRELRSEIKKVTWPSGASVRQNTGVVLVFVCVIGLFLAGVDGALGFAVDFLLNLGK